MKSLGIIPARYASSRFPGKPLAIINGKTMINRVFEQAKESSLDKIIIATDDRRIFDHCLTFTGDVVMTAKTHRSGTDRCAEVARGHAEFDITVNIQGDEPFLDAGQINLLIDFLKNGTATIATLAKKITKAEDIFNKNVVKVVFDKNRRALYFSRHPIPFLRGIPEEKWLTKGVFHKHIGLYGFLTGTLTALADLPRTGLEIAESLEQLRWLENGYKIGVALTEKETIGIDTPEDLKRIRKR